MLLDFSIVGFFRHNTKAIRKNNVQKILREGKVIPHI